MSDLKDVFKLPFLWHNLAQNVKTVSMGVYAGPGIVKSGQVLSSPQQYLAAMLQDANV